jgi:hypothetical protein
MSAETFRLESPRDDRARETDHAERGDSPTPRGVWRAIFEASIGMHWEDGPYAGDTDDDGCGHDLQHGWKCNPARVCSLMSGYGSEASEIRRRFENELDERVHITGVELFEPRRPDLEKWCDEVIIADWRAALTELDHVDLFVTNPRFELILENKLRKDLDPAATLIPTLLRHGRAVLILHREQAFTRSVRGREVLRRWPPTISWRVGPVSFDGTGSTDTCCYLATLFLRRHSGPTSTLTLRELTAAERRWTVPPGSEDPSEDLPAAPGWSPRESDA